MNEVSPLALEDESPTVVTPVNSVVSMMLLKVASVSKFDTRTFSMPEDETADSVKSAPRVPETEMLSVSIPAPPLSASPGAMVVPAAPAAAMMPVNVSLPFVLVVPAEPTSEEPSALVVSDLWPIFLRC